MAEIVEQHIADPPAQDDAESSVKDEVVGVAPGYRRPWLPDQLEQIPVTDEDAREIGNAIPAKVEAPDVQKNRR